jgi:hypothetical protein
MPSITGQVASSHPVGVQVGPAEMGIPGSEAQLQEHVLPFDVEEHDTLDVDQHRSMLKVSLGK